MPEQADVYVGIGSNMGDPVNHVRQAMKELERVTGTHCVARSGLYASPPMGPPGQPDYVNAVAHLRTPLAPLALLDELQAIEQNHNRTRDGRRWGPRTLDLDMLLYDDRSMHDVRLSLPHPGLHERAFVIYPLLEVAGDIDIPGRGPLSALTVQCPRGDLKRLASA